MRVLFISSFLLFGDSHSGGAKRLHYFAQRLAQDGELSLICLDAGLEADRFEPRFSPAARFLQVRYERSLLDKFMNPFAVPRYLPGAMKAELDAFIRADEYDVVFCAFSTALSLLDLPALAAAKHVVYLEDDLSFEAFKERMKSAKQPIRKLHMAARLWQTACFYQRLMRRVQGFVAISDEEAALVVAKFPWLGVRIVGYGIPIEEFPWLQDWPGALVLGFIGNYIHPSNTDAMEYFLREWYPAVKRRIPGITVHVAGKHLPAALSQHYVKDQSIVFMDNVPNLTEFYSGISIFVNPIITQRGLRTKLVESAVYGRPIISTPLGAEGLDDLDIAMARSAEEFVHAVERLREPGVLREVGARNRRAAERKYSIDTVGGSLVSVLKEFSKVHS